MKTKTQELIEQLSTALLSNGVFRTPLALRRKGPPWEWDEYETDAIRRTREGVAAAESWLRRQRELSQDGCDNTFESVLWRRLACDFRTHAGWSIEDMELSFRSTLRRTLEEYPPVRPGEGAP